MVLWVFVVIWLCFCFEEEVEDDVEEGVVSFLEIYINYKGFFLNGIVFLIVFFL